MIPGPTVRIQRMVIGAFVVLALVSVAVLAEAFVSGTQESSIAAAPTDDAPAPIREIQVCNAVAWTEHVPTYVSCTKKQDEFGCVNRPQDVACNTSNRSLASLCANGSMAVQRHRQECTTTGYVINGKTVINTTNYKCSVTVEGKTYLTCDSVYDGNGDGICTSGESCLQFGIVGNSISQKMRNSKDLFADYDPSYVLNAAEVLP